MEAELPTEYDVIVVGTGLVECIVAAASARVGKKVLHIDKNDYYGGQWASFTLRNIEQWVEEHTASHQETKNTEECALEEGEKLAPTSDPRRVYSKVKLSWHAHDEAPTASEESATKDDSGEGSSEETTTPKAETKDEAKEIKTWSQEEMMQLSRKYAEFKCITRVLTWLVNGGDEGSLLVVPCSRSDVFTTSSVSLVEKRLLMKFLEFCHSYDQQPEQLEEYADKPFVDFLKSRKLTDNITHFVTDSIAMVVGDVPCKEGLERMKLFLTSLGRYGTTPFLFSMYGCGELPQAFCRLCAVFEGTYILRRPVSSLIINSGNTCLGLVSEGQRFKCSHLVIDAAYAPQEYAAIGSSPKQPSLSRGIFIIDRSILPNEKEQLTLLRLPAKDGNPQIVTILEVGGGSGVCPKDLYCVHMTCQGYDAEEDLKIAVQRLFGCGATSQPTVLMSLYFNLVDLSACDLVSGAPTNVYLCSGPDTELDYDFAIDQAKNVFTRMFPEEEFLPRAPDPDEIVFDNAGAEPKDGDNFDSNTKMGEKDEATVNPENRTDEEKALAADEVLSSTKEGSS
ncbi:Rab proteins geranylgeranyltransferase component A-like [Homarus americanus]|uniref:Rab proteins geranylgeranyltransferase component A n=1 Tax=Homarus americanus TaxID=6706 RepID=A0A8J5JTP8_HOMAM|nr:Rab proteins geranylgeranyltransferase component A-like [Homarus americanus]